MTYQDGHELDGSIMQALEARKFMDVRRHLRSMGPADVSQLLASLDPINCIMVFRLVSKLRRSEVFAHLPVDRQLEMLERLPDVMVVRLLNDLEPVDRTKLLEDIPEDLSEQFIAMLTPSEKAITQTIMAFPEDSVGRLMSPEFMCLEESISASEGIEEIKWRGSQFPENLISIIFVVDREGKYLGQVSIAGLISADPPRVPVGELCQQIQPGLPALASETDAVHFFRKYDVSLMPVVDDRGCLIGVIEADDVFDIAEEEATEDIQQFGGHDPLEDSYFLTPLMVLIRKRAGWLALLFVGMMFTANALKSFEPEIAKWGFLVIFLPLIISSGGNSGSQAASLMIRSLAVQEVDPSDWFRVFRREMLVGSVLGGILSLLGFIRVLIAGEAYMVGIVVGVALWGIVLFGAIIGSMLPFLLKKLGLDPAVSSSPVIASMVDIIGIIIFFRTAIFILEPTSWSLF